MSTPSLSRSSSSSASDYDTPRSSAPASPTANKTDAAAQAALSERQSPNSSPAPLQQEPLLELSAVQRIRPQFILKESLVTWGGKLYKISQDVDPATTPTEWDARVKACEKILAALESDPSPPAKFLKPGSEFKLFLTRDQGAIAEMQFSHRSQPIFHPIANTQEITHEILEAGTNAAAKQIFIAKYTPSAAKATTPATRTPSPASAAATPATPVTTTPAPTSTPAATASVAAPVSAAATPPAPVITTPAPTSTPAATAPVAAPVSAAATPPTPVTTTPAPTIPTAAALAAAAPATAPALVSPIHKVVFRGGENRCYLNATVQVLFNDPILREVFKKAMGDSDLDREILSVLNQYEAADPERAIDLETLRTLMVAENPDMKGGRRGQEDTDASYLTLLRRLEKKVDSPLGAIALERARGQNDKSQELYSRTTNQHNLAFVHLNLKIDPTAPSLDESLKNYLSDQSIDQSEENAPKRKAITEKGEEFTPLGKSITYAVSPNALFLHLNRNEYMAEQRSNKKNEVSIEVPLQLEIPDKHLLDQQYRGAYQLTGFTHHRGGGNGGHYVAYLRKFVKLPDGEHASVYYLVNDDRIEEINELVFLKAAKQGSNFQYLRNDIFYLENENSSRAPEPDRHPQT